MSAAAASTETTQRCGSIDRAGTERRIETLYARVLSHTAKLITWAVYRYLNDARDGSGSLTLDETFKSLRPAADAKWANAFISRIGQKIQDEDPRWTFIGHEVEIIDGDKINIIIEICETEDTLHRIANSLVDLVDASNAAETEICALQAAVAGQEAALLNLWRADSIAAERVAEEAEVRVSGTTVNA